MCNIIIYVINQKNIFEAFRKSECFLFYANNRRALVRLLGRKKIYTDYSEITADNIIEVLGKSYAKHRMNVSEINFLIDYERGIQPLKREKKIRSDIDVRVNSNLANYVKEFKLGYNWSDPIMLVQRGDKEMHATNATIDDSGISGLNEMLCNGENIAYKDQSMGEFVEICGVGYKMVDIKTDFSNPVLKDEKFVESLVNVYSLDSRYAFCVYHNGPGEKKLMGVSFRKSGGKNYFTCFTDKWRFEIIAGKVIRQEKNPMEAVPIVEYERSFDRTGCFERELSKMDALNILLSDFTNDVSQRTQEMWWGDNIDFKKDEKTGETIKPKSGDWILTYSADGKVAKIAPLSSSFDTSGTLAAIKNLRTEIFQDCKVPIQYDSSGGGSTGIATDMSSGWSATELDARREQQMTERGKREELKLILKAITFVPENVLPMGHPIRNVHITDVNFHFNRRRNYDLINKANFVAQMINLGFNGRHVLKEAEVFPDVEQVWNDSKEIVEAIQQSKISSTTAQKDDENVDTNERLAADNGDQISNSPILDGTAIQQDSKGGD